MNIRNAKSIADASTFQQTMGEYSDALIRHANFRPQTLAEERTPAYQLAEAAENAAYDALVAVVDAYCMEKTAQTLSTIESGLPVKPKPTQPFFIQQPYRRFELYRHVAEAGEVQEPETFDTLFDLIAALPVHMDWLRADPAHSLSAIGIFHKASRDDTLFEIMHPTDEHQLSGGGSWFMVTGKEL